MSDAACNITVTRAGTDAEVSIGGEFDLAAVNDVRVELDPLLGGAVAVDLSGITFIDSSGLQCLLHLHAEARQRGGRIVVSEVSAVVQRLLELSGVEDYLLSD